MQSLTRISALCSLLSALLLAAGCASGPDRTITIPRPVFHYEQHDPQFSELPEYRPPSK